MANLITYDAWINGDWYQPVGGEYFDSVDPTSGKAWARIARCDKRDVDHAVKAAKHAFDAGEWSSMNAADRGQLLWKMGDLIVENAGELAAVETQDNGKRTADILPGLQSWLAESFWYYAGLADKIHGDVIPANVTGILNYTRREPFGVVASITAWNSPLLIAIWKIAPALAAGNTMVIKPSEHASTSTLALMKVLSELIPPGVLNVVTGFGQEVGEPLVDHPEVRMISFTGSISGGRRVAEVAARQIKPVVMELGGKSPQIVFPDVKLDDAAHGVVMGLFPPAGQSCVAGSRLLVQKEMQDELVHKICAVASQARLGPPLGPDTQIGPMANKPHFERVMGYIEQARNEGAECVLGGKSAKPEGTAGWFIEPTVFRNVSPEMQLFREELFGPVLAVVPFEDEEEAVSLANDTVYGLAAGIWTGDVTRAIRIAERIQAGTIYVNNYFNSATQSPVGGYKQSGYGRENGIEGMLSFMQTKSVWLSTQHGTPNPFG